MKRQRLKPQRLPSRKNTCIIQTVGDRIQQIIGQNQQIAVQNRNAAEMTTQKGSHRQMQGFPECHVKIL